jgi:tRNA dimethylallyltransferase
MKIFDKDEIVFIRNNKKHFTPDFLSVRQLMIEKKIIPVICGPTSAGKSALAFNLAKILETDIISIDSMQVYKGLNIGTDKYDSSQIGINQYMTDIFEPDHKLTVVEFRDICRNIIEEEFFKNGRVPIMAGGSGLYLRAVIDELDFTAANDSETAKGEDGGSTGKEKIGVIAGENDNNEIREELYSQAEISEGGLLRLYMKLKQVDPLYAAKISPNDKKRVIRAIEVYALKGRPFSSFQNKWQNRKSIYNCIMIGLLTEKERLHTNIEKRVDMMLKNGLILEVQTLVKQGYKDCNSLTQAVGYKEVLKYLNGDIDIDICRQEIIKNTKRLAKKQMTWFKADPRINWISTDNYDNIFDLTEHVFNIFRKDILE